MIRIKYEKYYNDYNRSFATKSFNTLNELADWMFDMVYGKYDFKIYFTDPNDPHISNEKLRLDSSCIYTSDNKYRYWIHQIEKDGKIIYSCGTFTNGICHWNDEIKDWLRTCRDRMNNPQFNFG